jgi:hypothetical protein
MSNSRNHPMGTLSDLPPRRSEKRKVFILPLWARGKDEPVWIGEVQDVSTGEVAHMHSLEALFDWLKQKTSQVLESSAKKEK